MMSFHFHAHTVQVSHPVILVHALGLWVNLIENSSAPKLFFYAFEPGIHEKGCTTTKID